MHDGLLWLLGGRENWNHWRRRKNRINLSGVSLARVNLSGYDLRGVNFEGANLRGAVLREACMEPGIAKWRGSESGRPHGREALASADVPQRLRW